MTFYYLAQAYSHEDETIKKDRVEKGAKATGRLIQYGVRKGTEVIVFAPIVHNDPIYAAACFSMKERLYTFETLDFFMLEKADAMILLTLPGWEESYGVEKEIAFCKEKGIPIRHLAYEDIEDDAKLAKILEN